MWKFWEENIVKTGIFHFMKTCLGDSLLGREIILLPLKKICLLYNNVYVNAFNIIRADSNKYQTHSN